MGLAVNVVASGGLAVTEAALGLPVEIAPAGFGIPVTVIAAGGLSVKGAGGIVLSAFSVAENSANSTVVGTASIVGTTTGTPSWSITDASGTFAINSSSGVVTVSNNSALNYEVNQSLPVTISVSGVTPTQLDLNISISITNVVETPVNSAVPTISGTPAVGNLMSVASTGTWTDMGAGTFTYQWKSNGSSIGGATSSTYTLLHAQAGTTITVTVTATNSAGSASATSAASAAVTETVANTVAPVVSGTTQVGSTLSTTDGTWNGYPAPSFAYQWKRNGVSIGSATANTYLLVTADLGSNITCLVTATGGATALSNSVGPITAAAGSSFGGETYQLLFAA